MEAIAIVIGLGFFGLIIATPLRFIGSIFNMAERGNDSD
jgi:hypothetical protein